MATRKTKSRGGENAADKRNREIAIGCARVADERRGTAIVVLHIEEAILVTDYFVIVSARTKRQIQAIAADARSYMRENGIADLRMEGYEEGSWVLIDSGTIVVHVFQEELRGYYDLELLWGDAPKIDWRPGKGAKG